MAEDIAQDGRHHQSTKIGRKSNARQGQEPAQPHTQSHGYKQLTKSLRIAFEGRCALVGFQSHDFVVGMSLFGQLMPADEHFSQRTANQGSGNKAEGSGCHGDGIGPFQTHLFQQRRKAAGRTVPAAHGDGTGGHAHQRAHAHTFGYAQRKQILQHNEARHQDNHHHQGFPSLLKDTQIALITHRSEE